MAARITLLILSTWLFAAAWSSDHALQPTSGTVPRQPLSPSPEVQETTLRRWSHSEPLHESISQNSPWVPTAEAETIHAKCPPHIAPGNYLVVTPDGRSSRVVIPSQMQMEEFPFNRHDHYVWDSHGERQHWIRLEETSLPRNGHETVVVVLVERSEKLEKAAEQQAEIFSELSLHPVLQRLIAPWLEGKKILSRKSQSPIAAEPSKSMNR